MKSLTTSTTINFIGVLVAARQAYAAKHTTLQTRNGHLSNKLNNKDIDIRKEDIEFFTRTLQQSFPPTPQPNPIPTTPAPIPTRNPRTPNPTDPPVPVETPNPTDPTDPPVGVITPNPTDPVPLVCGLPVDIYESQMRELALTITDAATLNNQGSPQAKALNWLLTEDTLDPPVCPDDGPCGARQRYIMASFYYASGGGTWDQCNAPQLNTAGAIALANANCDRVVTPFPVNNPRIGATSTDAWLTGVDECLWGGLACWGTDDDRNGCMDQIDFENDGLSGNLIPEVTNLDQLRFFILEQGSIGGTIPSEYGEFDRLLIFDLDFNELSGSIPDELFDMKVLQQLDLNDNNLDGALSTNIGSMTTLTFLQLDHNNLEGTIPTEVGLLKSLRIAFFNDNDFTGSMPAQVCANRNNTSPPGFLGTLVSDCNPPNNPEVECPCCSSCNVALMQQEFDTSNVSPSQLLRSNDEPVLTTSALDEEVQIEETNTIVPNRYSGSSSGKSGNASSGKSGKASSGKSSKASAKAGKARA